MPESTRMSRLVAAAKTPKTEDSEPPLEGPICFESVGELVDFLTQATLGECAGLEEAEKWIQKAVEKPGRCSGANFGGSDCPKGSPQYNLAVRLKPGGDLYKKAHGKKKEQVEAPGLKDGRYVNLNPKAAWTEVIVKGDTAKGKDAKDGKWRVWQVTKDWAAWAQKQIKKGQLKYEG